MFFDRSLGYSDRDSDGTNDIVTLSFTRTATFRSFAETANQRPVAGALESLPADNATARDVMAATAREEIRSAYDGLSGEVLASLKGALMDAGRATAAAVNRRLARLGARDGFWVEGHGGRSETDAMTFATLGLRGSMALDDAVRVRALAGWRHAFGDTAPSSAHSMAGGAPFAVAGAPVAQDALDIELGIEAGLTDTATFGAAYTGQYGGGAGHGVTAELRVAL